MKYHLSFIVLLLLLVIFAVDCQKEISVTDVKLNKSSLTLVVYDSEILLATVIPDKATNKKVIFKSSDTSVATVASNGLVIGLSKGVATITVTTDDGNFSATCNVNVIFVEIPVTGVKLNKTKLHIDVGETEQLITTLSPQYATNKVVTFTSSDSNVVTVTPDGLVTAMSNGVSMVSVCTDDGNFRDSCLITVGVIPVTDVFLNKTMIKLKIDESDILFATVLPEYATNKDIKWSSENEQIAIVFDGLVSPKGYGTTTITVTTLDGNKKATCDLEVYSTIEELDMVFVSGGEFTMGCTNEQVGDCFSDEYPAHHVTLSSFQISKYLITQKQWKEVMGNFNPSYFQGDDLPIETISFFQIDDFIKKLNSITGKKYRLPTEAEWEYAARGGVITNQYKYSGSDDINVVAWFLINSYNRTHPIDLKEPNELGIFDMSGNVWEVCSDWFGNYVEEPQIDPTGPLNGEYRTSRGGSYDSNAAECRVSARRAFVKKSEKNTGFRLVLPIQ